MVKLLNVENDWDGMMGPVVSFRKKRLHQLLEDYKLEMQLVRLV